MTGEIEVIETDTEADHLPRFHFFASSSEGPSSRNGGKQPSCSRRSLAHGIPNL